MSIRRSVTYLASRACCCTADRLRNEVTLHSSSGMWRATISSANAPQRRKHANSSANRSGSSERPSAMNWFSVPPHMNVGTTFSKRTGDADDDRLRRGSSREKFISRLPGGELGGVVPAHVPNGHREPGDAEEIELVGDRVKQRRDGKCRERDLRRRGEHANVPERTDATGISLNAPRCSKAHEQQRDEQQDARDPEIDGVLEKGVVHRAPCCTTARSVQRQVVLAEAPTENGIRDHD